jgi:hypothetical protein
MIRHHTSGKFATAGRSPKAPHATPAAGKAHVASIRRTAKANLTYNKRMDRATKSGTDATPGQLVGAGIKLN